MACHVKKSSGIKKKYPGYLLEIVQTGFVDSLYKRVLLCAHVCLC